MGKRRSKNKSRKSRKPGVVGGWVQNMTQKLPWRKPRVR